MGTTTTTSQSSAPVTLERFIDENSKLVTSIAAFVALAAFSFQLDVDRFYTLSALSLIAALVLGLELQSRIPSSPRHWRLNLFASVLATIILVMGVVWIDKFWGLWTTLLWRLVPAILVLAVLLLLTVSLGKTVSLVASKVLRLTLDDAREVRIRQTIFVTCAVLCVVAFFVAWAKLGGHIYTIKTPSWMPHF